MAERAEIIVRGIVQGVGFRPYVFRLARSLHLNGSVTNTSDGVLIDVEGHNLAEFVRRLSREAPPLSRITNVSVTSLPVQGYSGFSIIKSSEDSVCLPFTLVSPDVSVCGDCLKELLDPSDRRFLYPFINCTNCGPRYSITRSVPYDRPNTTMAPFTMCRACQKEYDDPGNRRFHAQPNACPVCGPAAEYRVGSAEWGMRNKEAVAEAVKLLKRGGIIAVKGLGGFHIACDASNDQAVKRLREKKRKSNKPFAVMTASLEAAERFCAIADSERKQLLSGRRPIVLVSKKQNTALSEAVSPANRYIGIMLPYTPLHYLLFYHPLHEQNAPQSPVFKGGSDESLPSAEGGKGGFDEMRGLDGQPHFTALVMTSGNLSEEPIVRDNDEAMKKLSPLVDGFLLHNREIFMRVDDSVVRAPSSLPLHSALFFMRRSRGYAPDPIELRDEGPEVMGCGADLKNTFTITKGKFAIPGQHIGDMENYETVSFFEESLQNIKSVYRADPKVIVHDLHPGYLSTQWAINQSALRTPHSELKLYGVQHHYAHIGSVMAEHGLTGTVIGVAFDGTGYGTDGNLWGGEFLIAGIEGFERAAQFRYVPLPGGESAIREPWKTAVSMVMLADPARTWQNLASIGFIARFGRDRLNNVIKVAQSSELSPFASGAGRLFDAVSSLLGLCYENTFEGEAAMSLEALTIEGIEEEYPVELTRENGYTVVDFSPAISKMIADAAGALPRNVISTRFHNTVASVIRTVVRDISNRQGIRDVALSGGTFQNLYLLNRAAGMLTADGMNVYTNLNVPCNDGGISLGQAYLVRERLRKSGVRNGECGI